MSTKPLHSNKPRPSKVEYFLQMAELVATRSTCLHRHQGSVITRDNRVISTGYNGSPPGGVHCTDASCRKVLSLDCRAEGLHGESNAIATAARLGIALNGATIYSVFSPCLACCNLILTAGIICVVYREIYENYYMGPEYLHEHGIITIEVPTE